MEIIRENHANGELDAYSKWVVKLNSEEKHALREYEDKYLHVFTDCVVASADNKFYVNFANYMNQNRNARVVTNPVVIAVARGILAAYKGKDTYDSFPLNCDTSINVNDLI